MGEPRRAMLVRSVTIAGRALDTGTTVWRHDGGEIEHRGNRARVPDDALVDLPVRAPSREALRALDACFGLPAEAFDVEHDDATSYFSIVRCKAHGRRFLRDLRGGVASYATTTLLDDDDGETPESTWRRYHALPIDWLHYLGRTG